MSICQGDGGGASGHGQETEAGTRTSGGREASQKRATLPSRSDMSGLNVSAPPFAQNTTSLYVSTRKTVLLRTALTTVQNANHPEVGNKLRAVLDLGSQRSCITQRAAGALQLESGECAV